MFLWIRLGVSFVYKDKKTIIGSIACLIPMILGLILWSALPDKLYAQVGMLPNISKGIMVFLVPILFLLLHLIVVYKSDWLNKPRGEYRYWYVPLISNVVFVLIFTWNLR